MQMELEEQQSGKQNAAVPAASSLSLLPLCCLVKVVVIF